MSTQTPPQSHSTSISHPGGCSGSATISTGVLTPHEQALKSACTDRVQLQEERDRLKLELAKEKERKIIITKEIEVYW